MTLGEKIVDLRKKRGLSQEELAISLGVSRQAVSKWEVGDAMPDTDKVVALAEYFGVTTDWLLRDIEPAAAPHPADTIPSAAAMLRDTPMLFNLTIGGNIFGAALMLYDLWQQTYYHIPTVLGLFLQLAGTGAAKRRSGLAAALLAMQHLCTRALPLLLGGKPVAGYCRDEVCHSNVCRAAYHGRALSGRMFAHALGHAKQPLKKLSVFLKFRLTVPVFPAIINIALMSSAR